jgi:4-amino-4-deoxy-L-arabinose transferase-like glycosyltransferase
LRAAETGKMRWLILSAALMGVAFNVKMLEAFLALPAIFLVYLFGSQIRPRVRLWHLTAAIAVLAVISLSWVTAVDLTPASARPYIGSSGNNTEIGLALGYNGLGRLLGQTKAFTSPGGVSSRNIKALQPRGVTSLANSLGPQRLLQSTLGGQAGWFIVVAAVGMLAIASRTGKHLPLNRRQLSILMWAVWLLTAAAYVSVAGTVHGYYLAMLAPPAAALFAIGVSLLWDVYRSSKRWWWALPAALLAAAAGQAVTLSSFTPTYDWLILLVAAGCVGAVILLALCKLANILAAPVVAVWIAVSSLFAAPLVWTEYTIVYAGGGATSAGPNPVATVHSMPAKLPFYEEGIDQTRPVQVGSSHPQVEVTLRLVRYLEAHRGGYKYIAATFSAGPADAIIIAGGLPVMDLGGFKAWDRILNQTQLAGQIYRRSVRYFLVAADGSGVGVNGDLEQWVMKRCSAVPAIAYGAIPSDRLYRCPS